MYEPGNKIGNFDEADLDRLLGVLKADQEYSPRAGFYARVLNRVESAEQNSIWSAFLEPWFGKRLALASAVLMVVMSVALMYPGTPEWNDEANLDASYRATLVAGGGQSAGSDDAVLVNLVTYREH